MRKFLDRNFLLTTPFAEKLYHEHAEKMPIYDYHCHLNIKTIAENKRFKNITELWLSGDHYKWRLMRANGISEKYCSGNSSPEEKFLMWAKTLPYTIGNPLFVWSCLELKRYFNIDEILSEENAIKIYEKCNRIIKDINITPYLIFKKMNVKVICTTDDPLDTLKYHIKIKKEGKCPAKVYPAFRPDKAMAVESISTFTEWTKKLSNLTGIDINSYENFIKALSQRHSFFHKTGSRISDHAIEKPFAFKTSRKEINEIFEKIRSGKSLDETEILKFKTSLLLEFAKFNYNLGWVMQLHIGVLRNVNTKMFKRLGPDTGFDTIGDYETAKQLSLFLDILESENKLPKMILYSINPKDNSVLSSLIGCFQDGKIPGKMQVGSAWWFLDNKDGIEEQLKNLANMGLLSKFVGMLTDSRSFMSYPRHEYFRRILCNLLGNMIETGEIPSDIKNTGKIVEDICYNNAVRYFNLP